MLKFGVIERARSEFINPIVTVIKKNGTVRLCIDGRELNMRLVSDHDGPEDMDDVFRKCANIRIMSSFDLSASFWQIPLARESRKYTAFMHRGMTYQHTVVPFGTKVSSATLTRASETLINDLKDFIINFVDDWLCVSESFEDHLTHIKTLLRRCLLEGITLNFEKIEFFHILTIKGIRPDPDKVEAIQNFPTPKNVKTLKGFLGLTQICAKLTTEIAQESAPLLELERKGVKWSWEGKHEEAFIRVKKLFSAEALLHHPCRDRPRITSSQTRVP